MNIQQNYNGASYLSMQFQTERNVNLPLGGNPDLGLVRGDELDPATLARFVLATPQEQVQNATASNVFDNNTGARLRSDYANTFNQAGQARELASQEVDSLGAGRHTLPNGDVVDISINPWSGHKTVSTDRRDGSHSSVTYSDLDPSSVTVNTRNADGSRDHLEAEGSKVSKSHTQPGNFWTGQRGTTVSDTFSLDANGRPVQETSGPALDQYRRVTANPDGSTDTLGEGLNQGWTCNHQDPGFTLPTMHPDPWLELQPRYQRRPWDVPLESQFLGNG